MIATLDEMARDLKSLTEAHGVTRWPPSEQSQTLAIIGDRGSGKSTLLAAVCHELVQRDGYLVLSTIQPELFSQTDSILGAFLAELWDMHSEPVEPDAPEDEREARSSLIKQLSKTARSFAISRTTIASLEAASDGPDGFAEDILTVARKGAVLQSELRKLAQRLCFPADRNRPRLVIVPIDDPDLGHAGIGSILTDLQTLGGVPGIVPITGFAVEDLRDTWMSERVLRAPHASEERRRFTYARQFEKVFPHRCRFEIEPIEPGARWGFTPVGRNGTLGERLKSFSERISRQHAGRAWSLAEALREDHSDLGLTSALPENPRTLVQLWEVLDFGAHTGDRDGDSITLRRLLDALSEGLAAQFGMTPREFIAMDSPEGSSGKKRLSIRNHERVALRISALGTFDETKAKAVIGVAEIRLRRLAEFNLEQVSDGKAAAEQLSAKDLTALLAVQDVAFGSGMFDVETPPELLAYVEWAWLQQVELAKRATDNVFLTLPPAASLTDYVWAARRWNAFVDLVAEAEDVEIVTLLATVVSIACASLDRSRRPVQLVTDYDAAFRRARRLYLANAHDEAERARSFCDWFTYELPVQWHSAFFSGEDVRRFAQAHQETCSTPDRTYVRPKRSLLDMRIKRILEELETGSSDDRAEGRKTHAWVAGYFDVVSVLQPEQAEEVGKLYLGWQRFAAGVRAGAALAGLVSHKAGGGRMSPYATPEGTELFAAAQQALKRLRKESDRRIRGAAKVAATAKR